MPKVGSSSIIINSVFVDYEAFRGPIGATGTTGATGPIGTTGPTGPTGYGVDTILRVNSDGITVYLLNNTEIFVSGLSGNTFTDFSNALYLYDIVGSTGTIPNQSFNIKGGVEGLTATFKTITGIRGLTVSYVGNDLKFAGVTTASVSIGRPGDVLFSNGNTAAVTTLFTYEENAVGITTVNLGKVKSSVFAQKIFFTANKNLLNNINPLNEFQDLIGTTAGRQNTTLSQFEYDPTDPRTTRVYTNSNFTNILGNTGTRNIIFRETINTNPNLTYNAYSYGSCCYCDVSGKKQCLDYVSKEYCEDKTNGLNGSFSFISCNNRNTTDCNYKGACCFGSNCTMTDITSCARLGGTFKSGRNCSESGICT